MYSYKNLFNIKEKVKHEVLFINKRGLFLKDELHFYKLYFLFNVTEQFNKKQISNDMSFVRIYALNDSPYRSTLSKELGNFDKRFCNQN